MRLPWILAVAVTSLGTVQCKTRLTSGELSSETSSQLNGRGKGLVVLAGGRSEGEIGETNSWSYQVYKYLLMNCQPGSTTNPCRYGGPENKTVMNGDIDGDGVVRVAFLSAYEHENLTWMPNYFVWIGSTFGLDGHNGPKVEAKTYLVRSREAANAEDVVGEIRQADVIFVKGGNQADQRACWDGTLLETNVADVVARGGSIGGTSAGPITLSEFCNCGGGDFDSFDLMVDGRSRLLNDVRDPKRGGFRRDFLPIMAGSLVDTHVDERARLGRTLAMMAEASEEFGTDEILGIGIGVRTGLVIAGPLATVIGEGNVFFARPTERTRRAVRAGEPPLYTDLAFDLLADGTAFDLVQREPILDGLAEAPGSQPLGLVSRDVVATKATEVAVLGSAEADAKIFTETAIPKGNGPFDFELEGGQCPACLLGTFGLTRPADAEQPNTRWPKYNAFWQLAAEHVDDVGFVVYPGTKVVWRKDSPTLVSFRRGTGDYPASSVIIVHATEATRRGRSEFYRRNAKEIDPEKVPVILTGLKAHVVPPGLDGQSAIQFDVVERALVTSESRQ